MNNNENSFNTQIELDLMLDRKDNYSIETEKLHVKWNVEFEMRSFGIKSVIVTVPEQTIDVEVRVWGDDDDTFEQISFDLKDVEVVRESEGFENLIPSKLECYKGKWKLIF